MQGKPQPLPRCSIVITTCVDSPGLRANLEQVVPQAAEVGAEICLIFNCAPEDVASESRRELAELVDHLLFESTPGKSAALNTAISAVQGEVIAFTDDDAIPCSGWLRSLLQPFAEDPTVAGVGGPVLPLFEGDGPPRWYRRLLARQPSSFLGPKHFHGNQKRPYECPTGDRVDGVPFGANCAWRRDALLRHPYPQALGPNRATGLRGGEDTYVAIKIMEEGYPVMYQPAARVVHPVEPSRMTVEYVLEGYRIQAIEYVRIVQHLGRELPKLPKLKKHLAAQRRKTWARWLQNRDRRVRRQTRRVFTEQLVQELQGLQGTAPTPSSATAASQHRQPEPPAALPSHSTPSRATKS